MGVKSEVAIRLLAAVLVALLGLLGAAATAHADNNDDKFLKALKSEGITDQSRPITQSRPAIRFVRNSTRA